MRWVVTKRLLYRVTNCDTVFLNKIITLGGHLVAIHLIDITYFKP